MLRVLDLLERRQLRLRTHVIERHDSRSGLRTRAIMAVHIAGRPVAIADLVREAASKGIAVVEDAAHAFPSRIGGAAGPLAGTVGRVGAYSFYATKTITTGEGGMLVTDDDAIAERARLMSLHGISRDAWKRYTAAGSWYYEIEDAGYKYNMTDIAAALGLVQLSRAEELMTARRALAAAYSARLAASAVADLVELPADTPDGSHAWHLYIVRLALERLSVDRAAVIDGLRELGIGTSVHFIPLHLHPYYRREWGYRPSDLPVASREFERVVSLPLWPGMSDADVERVVGGLEVVRTLDDHRVRTARPVVVAFFTDEEGSRFGTDMLGSAVATGRLSLEQAYALADREGATVRGELERIGFLGEASEKLAPPHAYLECHIEQGPVLRTAGLDVGVVTGVQAICWHELSIVGRSAHAGTTPMSLRADPGVAAARICLAAREMAVSGRYGEGMRATMGVIGARPGLVNVVPSEIVCTVDLRNPDDDQMRRAERDITALYETIAREQNVKLSWRRTARTDTVSFSPAVQERVAKAADARGSRHMRIVSGAGHDAQEMARVCPAGMVFVPGENDGISHNPRELSTPDQCANGVNVLLDVLLSFAQEDGTSAAPPRRGLHEEEGKCPCAWR